MGAKIVMVMVEGFYMYLTAVLVTIRLRDPAFIASAARLIHVHIPKSSMPYYV